MFIKNLPYPENNQIFLIGNHVFPRSVSVPAENIYWASLEFKLSPDFLM